MRRGLRARFPFAGGAGVKRLTAFYFSGTGNTRYLTEWLSGLLAERYEVRKYALILSADGAARAVPVPALGRGELAAEGIRRAVAESDLVLIAYPVYGSSPPLPVRRFLHTAGNAFKDKEIAVAATQYMFSGDGAAAAGRTAERYGGRVKYAEHFDMPNNLSDCRIFSVKNGEELRAMLDRTERKMEAFARRILDGKPLRRGFNPVSHAVGYFCQRALWRRHENGKKDRLRIDPSRCTGCGLCAGNCPAANLRVEKGKAVPAGRCILCYRCVNLCPVRAVTLLGAAPPAKQYKGVPPAPRR